MSNASTLFRSLLIYGLCVPLAIILGYLAAQPIDTTTVAVIVPLAILLVTPLLLRWHHTWLIAVWQSTLMFYFINATAWMGLVWVSLLISVLQYTLNRRLKFLSVGPMIKPLIFLAVVIIITARCRGGVGVQMLGASTVGGKRYFILLTAIAGFFAITARAIPPKRALFFIGLFFAGQATVALSELSAFAPSWLYFVFIFFPATTALGARPYLDNPMDPVGVARLGSLATACAAVIWFMLARYGIGSIFTWRRLGRLLIFLALLFVSLLGGYRSILVYFLLTFAILFYLEGQVRKPLLPALTLVALLCGSLLIPFVNHLPLTVQRTLSFLPVRVDPVAQASADVTTEWRIRMWKNVLPQIPQYLWLGKGYGINAADLAMANSSALDGGTYGSEIAGDYHSGPLSLIIPFGLPGVIAFLWLLIAGFKVLRQNLLYGDPTLVQINRVLLSLFVGKIIFYFSIFGGFAADLAYFTGLVGLSICVNGGVAVPAIVAPQPKLVYDRFKIPHAIRKPLSA